MSKRSIPKPPTPPPIRVVKDGGGYSFPVGHYLLLMALLVGLMIGGTYGR